MGISYGQVIDYLVTSLTSGVAVTVTPGNTVTVAPLTSIEATAVVSDNAPVTSSETQVIIGRTSPASGAAGDVDWAYQELGAGRIEESYVIPGYVAVWRPGPAQKPARDAMVSLVDGVVGLVHTDPTFGGILQRGRYAIVSKVAFHQTQDDEDTAGGGYMYACADFEITVQNSYIP